MPELDIVAAVKDVGFPIALSIYLLFMIKSQTTFYGERLDDIKNILKDLAAQTSYMLSANISYRSGNIEAGDIMSRQAAYVGDKINQVDKDDGEGGGK